MVIGTLCCDWKTRAVSVHVMKYKSEMIWSGTLQFPELAVILNEEWTGGDYKPANQRPD